MGLVLICDYAALSMWKRLVEKKYSCHGVAVLKRECFINNNYISQNS